LSAEPAGERRPSGSKASGQFWRKWTARQRSAQALTDWLLAHGFGRLFPRDPHWLGVRGEALAFRELERRGYTIIDRRARLRGGEIDAVAWDGPVLVFVEVKTRRGDRYGAPEEAVDLRKQRKLLALAPKYMASKGLDEVPVRFDVVSVEARGERKPRITVLQGAFEE
jgi:putative endonuclease